MGDAVDRAKRPVAMVPDMVLAILDGSKTQTRRPVTPQPPPECGINYPLGNESWLPREKRSPLRRHWEAWGGPLFESRPEKHMCGSYESRSPLGAPGNLLWVRERARVVEARTLLTFAYEVDINQVQLRYEADGEISEWLDYPARLKTPTIGHCIANGCYREASRITLEVFSAWTVRLGDISEEDARAEGFKGRAAFFATWDGIYGNRGKGSDVNPWVWVTEFRRVGSEVHGGK